MNHTPVSRRLLLGYFASASFVALSIVLVPSVLRAQSASMNATQVASLVQAFYDQTTTLEASFHQTQYTKLYGRYDRARGRVVFKKPGKMRWDYDAPNGQVFVSDGRRLLVYQPPEEGEQHGQVIDRAVSDDQLPAAFSFLVGTGRLDRDFDVRLLDASRQGFADGYVLELRPKQPTPHYERVLFFVRVLETNGRRAGVIQRVLILDSTGNRNRFDFSGMQFNRTVADTRFAFSPPAGTRRVQP